MFRREKRSTAAGERTKAMRPGAARRRSGIRVGFVIRWALGILFALGLVGYVAVPPFQALVTRGVTTVVDQVRRVVAPTLTVEQPISAEASDSRTGHPVRLLFDRRTRTHWETSQERPHVDARFREAIDLGAIIVHSGTADGFVERRRPRIIELTFDTGETTTLTIEDVPDPQTFELNAGGVTSVRVRIVESYGPFGAPLAFSEIEFFRRE